MKFGKDFLWGASTAAYQIEGAAFEDGKGLCNWDVFCKQKGRIDYGDSGEITCDYYHLYEQDIKLLQELGVNSYRFSINWSRLIPNGIGKANKQGIDFYNKIIDRLIECNITPFITLFHFDYPQALEQKGSWLNPESPYWFEEYAKCVADNFGDRVKNFITINEPQCFLELGYNSTYFPPGIIYSKSNLIKMSHNILLGHGLAAKALHKYVKNSKVGYSPCGDVAIPYSQDDVEYARKCYFACGSDGWIHSVSWWSDPVVLGKYPDVPEVTKYLPEGWQDDLKIINEPLDFYGQNIYGGSKHSEVYKSEFVSNVPRTANKSAVEPYAVYWGPKFLYERYKLPIIITENGMAGLDWISLDGKVHDPQRIDFIERYINQIEHAKNDGVDIRGYFHWSLLDNFEWNSAFTYRFGLIYVDFSTGKRTKKDSFYFYKNIISESNFKQHRYFK